MIVTSVHLRLLKTSLTPDKENLNGAGKVLAEGSMRFDYCFQVEHVRVIERRDGRILVAMPSVFDNIKVKFHDVAHPLNADLRAKIDRAVLDEYARLTKPSRPVTVSPCPKP